MMIRPCGIRLCATVMILWLICVLFQLKYSVEKTSISNSKRSSNNYSSSVVSKEIYFTSLCSVRATKRGFNQKIIAMSLFGPVENPRMFSANSSLKYLEETAQEMQQIYPDNWTLRIYHNGQILDQRTIYYYQSRYGFIDFCNVTELHLDYIPPKIWRFLPAGDELVSVMASRDLDSPLTARERSAVDEWLSSNFTFHTMRDHPYHVTAVMGGMWAFRPVLDRTLARLMRSKILDRTLITKYSLNRDQLFLGEQFWPDVQEHAMSHDSFLCAHLKWNKNHRPFPVQRPGLNVTAYCYVGCPKPCCIDWYFNGTACPLACRPRTHQDWTYC